MPMCVGGGRVRFMTPEPVDQDQLLAGPDEVVQSADCGGWQRACAGYGASAGARDLVEAKVGCQLAFVEYGDAVWTFVGRSSLSEALP